MNKQLDLPTNDPGLSVTEKALNHIRRSLAKQATMQAVGLRVGVKKAGCSGFEYVLEAADPNAPKPLDYVFPFQGVSVLIDKEIYLKFFKGGTVMDYRKEGINEGLQFDNPNVGNQCGCGESFTLADDQTETEH